MADDVYELVQKALASKQGGRNQFYDPVADIALQVPGMIQQSNERKRLKNNDAFENLVNLATSANTPEAFTNISNSLSQLSKESGGDTQLQTNIAVLEGLNRTSRENYGIYKDGIDKGLTYVDSDAFPKELKDYENLDKIAFDADFKTEEGEGDIIAYLYAEKAKINSYRDKIGAGVEGGKKKFNYGKGMDSSVIRKLQEHDKRLNVAIQAYGLDGIITKEEAYHIQTGDLEAYKVDKAAAMGEAETLYKLGIKNSTSIDRLINSAKAKEFTADDLSELSVEFDIDGAELSTVTGGYEEIIKKLKASQILENNKAMAANTKYKRWAGRNYDDTYEMGVAEYSDPEFEKWKKDNPDGTQADYEELASPIITQDDEEEDVDGTLSLTGPGGEPVGGARQFEPEPEPDKPRATYDSGEWSGQYDVAGKTKDKIDDYADILDKELFLNNEGEPSSLFDGMPESIKKWADDNPNHTEQELHAHINDYIKKKKEEFKNKPKGPGGTPDWMIDEWAQIKPIPEDWSISKSKTSRAKKVEPSVSEESPYEPKHHYRNKTNELHYTETFKDVNGARRRDKKTYYHQETGEIKQETVYGDNRYSYGEKEFNKDGTLKSQVNFKDGKKDGVWINRDRQGGNINKGDKGGNSYENGQMQIKEHFKDGVLNGKSTEYYDNGQIKTETDYKDGEKNGKMTSYYKNGQITSEKNYKDNKKSDGKITIYAPDGSVEEVIYLKNGRKVPKKEFEKSPQSVKVWNPRTKDWEKVDTSNYISDFMKIPGASKGKRRGFSNRYSDEFKAWKEKVKEDTGWGDNKVTTAALKLDAIRTLQDKYDSSFEKEPEGTRTLDYKNQLDKKIKTFNEYMESSPGGGKTNSSEWYRRKTDEDLAKLKKSYENKLNNPRAGHGKKVWNPKTEAYEKLPNQDHLRVVKFIKEEQERRESK